MEGEDTLHEEVPCLCCRWEFLERYKVYDPGELVLHTEDHSVTFQRRKTHDEVHSDMGPGMPWDGQTM